VTERELIEALTSGFARAPEQLNTTHEADAEILRLGVELWAATVDDFSAEEDLFFDADPWLIGWNVVAATLSDLLCVGAVPRFFMPAVCIPPNLDDDFLRGLTRGAREALETAGCFLIGGDVGRAESWRYIGTAFGPVGCSIPLLRRVPKGRHTLWITGPLGAANVAAAGGLPPPQYPLRLRAAEAIRDLGVACTDTSGGFCDAVWNVHEATPGGRIEIDLDAVPFASGVADFAAAAGMPREAALLGGAGEYELLCAVPEDSPESTLLRLEDTGARMVGSVAWLEPAGVFFRRGDSAPMAMTGPPPCPRAAGTVENHIQEVARAAMELFGGEW